MIFFSLGARWVDESGKAALNSPEARNVLDWYGRMMGQYGPPAAYTLDINPASDVFASGKAAFYVDSPGFIGPLADPKQSAVAGNLGITKWPAGPAGSRTQLDCWAGCVSKFSTKKEAAWLWNQFISGKAMEVSLIETGTYAARNSVANGPEFKAFSDRLKTDLLAIRADGLKNGVVDVFPPINNITAARQVWGDALVGAAQGKPTAALADKANSDLQALIDKEH